MLAKGPNIVVSPRHPSNLEYITAIESVCTKLGHRMQKNLELILIESLGLPTPKPNLTKAQPQTIWELKRDRDHIV